jgi:hypothetical protein
MKLLVHVMGWFGNGQIHRMDSYNSNDPAVIGRQINVMKSARVFGLPISGVIMTWQGPYSTFLHNACMVWCQQCQQRGLLFGLLLDPNIVGIGPTPPAVATGPNANQTNYVIQALNHADVSGSGATTSPAPPLTPVSLSSGMINQPSYLPEKFVLDDSTGADWTQVASHVTGATVTMLGPPGTTFGTPGFAWPSINMGIANSESRNSSSVSGLQTQHGYPTMKIPAIMLRFMDHGQPTPVGVALGSWTGTRDYTQSVWGGQVGRVLDMQGGKLVNDYFATVPGAAPYLALVTWNDYDEGTDVEAFWAMTTGIRIGS